MVERESLRGVGKDAAGPLEATHRIHAWIGDHPGCTDDEVVKVALERQWVDPGYANRWYARHLNENRARLEVRRRKNGVAPGGATPSRETPASINADRGEHAQAQKVRGLIRTNIRYGSLGRDDDGGLRVLRPLRETQGLTREQIVTDPDETRADIAERELLRALRPLRDSLGVKYYRVPRDVQVKLQRWVDLKLVQRPT